MPFADKAVPLAAWWVLWQLLLGLTVAGAAPTTELLQAGGASEYQSMIRLQTSL